MADDKEKQEKVDQEASGDVEVKKTDSKTKKAVAKKNRDRKEERKGEREEKDIG